jgi:hypothetical protein
MRDEIIEELWQIKDKLARNANYDVRERCRQLREQQGKSGAAMVDRSGQRKTRGAVGVTDVRGG